jgi:hypothetical protein
MPADWERFQLKPQWPMRIELFDPQSARDDRVRSSFEKSLTFLVDEDIGMPISR